jgi:hypothetical protein
MADNVPFITLLAVSPMSIAELHRLGFDEGLAQHLLNFDESSLLSFRCQPPYYWRSSPIAERAITPIWECGTTLVYFDNTNKLFEKCSLEDIDQALVKYRPAQAVLADLFIELYEDELINEELRATANQLGFVHVERLLSEVAENSESPNLAWSQRFPLTCEG